MKDAGEERVRHRHQRQRVELARDAVGDPQSSFSCGEIGELGRCYADTAVWCAEGELGSEGCVAPSFCGWANGLGYRCTTESAGPCGVYDEAGACDGLVARWCDLGRLVEVECAAAQTCARSITTGRAGCF